MLQTTWQHAALVLYNTITATITTKHTVYHPLLLAEELAPSVHIFNTC